MGSHDFWYIYGTDRENGFLLDLVRRPEKAVARLAVYSKDKPPDVITKFLPLSDFVSGDDELKVRLGPIELNRDGCHGTLDEIDIDTEFSLTDRKIAFAPLWVHKLLSRVPYFTSYHGTLVRGTCQGISYKDLPLVYSTYRVGRISKSIWILISGAQFKDTDLVFDFTAGNVFGIWAPSAYIYFQGKEYKLNSALKSLFRFKIHNAGEIIGQERIFSASVRSKQISMEVKAKAPVSDFVLLEQEGNTKIHTAVFGNCEVSITLPGIQKYSFEAERTCMLEVKNKG